MEFFDALLPVGRTNGAIPEAPVNQAQLLKHMDRYFIEEALVVHTLSRDSEPELGNREILKYKHKRIHRVWAFDPSCIKKETPENFLDNALKNNVKAILLNPSMMGVNIVRTKRVLELAKLLEKRGIPLMLSYTKLALASDLINWYEIIDFCNMFPKLHVITTELRTLSNRPMLEALLQTKNLKVLLNSVWQAQMLEAIVENFGHERIIFSMGTPLMDSGDFQMVVNYADISKKAKEAVASGNIRKILKEANYEI